MPVYGWVEIQDMVDQETRAWDTQDVELLLSVFHPDMVWVWPPTNQDHDPINWEMVLGKFDYARWHRFYNKFFQDYGLVHNRRKTRKIEVSLEGDAAFAVVDIDTLWQNQTGEQSHWLGRVCKAYAKTPAGWKMTMQTGVLVY